MSATGENNWAVDVIVFDRKPSGNVAIKIIIKRNDNSSFI